MLVVCVAVGASLLLQVSRQQGASTILEIFAREAFDWTNSTTPAPLSLTATMVKMVLADQTDDIPGLGEAGETLRDEDNRVLDVKIAGVRDFLSSRILKDVQRLCNSRRGCNPNEVDPEFGITPLHVAKFWGSADLLDYLISIGSRHDVYDKVGRQPRNMSFPTFSKYSKMVGRSKLPPGADAEHRCEIPEVVLPLPPQKGNEFETSEYAAQLEDWISAADVGLSEVRRLASEGEPVVVRNMLPWLVTNIEKEHINERASLQYGDPSSFVQAWGHRPVSVGSVPYARVFNLTDSVITLQDYSGAAKFDDEQMGSSDGENVREDTTFTKNAEAGAMRPDYVFQVDSEACVEGRDLLGRVVSAALPSQGDRPLICPPASGARGLESVHYYLGRRGTGAPHHMHSDAINLVVTGKKKWWVLTPRNSIWSRRHIMDYLKHGPKGPWVADGRDSEKAYPEDLEDDSSPMECVQGAGDLVYVPADWGHAALNMEDDTFG